MLEIIEKGAKFDLTIQSKQQNPTKFYFGAGWDNPNGPVDLDIVCASLVGGKLTQGSDLVYFSNRTSPGIQLSEDNTTGEGEGDDENIVIDTSLIPSNVDSVVIGLAAYAGADLFTAPNAHFRVCDGDNEQSEQIGDIQLSGAVASDTVVSAFQLTRNGDNWDLENLAQFHQLGNGTGAIKGFGALYQ